jgi:hypothetical protein
LCTFTFQIEPSACPGTVAIPKRRISGSCSLLQKTRPDAKGEREGGVYRGVYVCMTTRRPELADGTWGGSIKTRPHKELAAARVVLVDGSGEEDRQRVDLESRPPLLSSRLPNQPASKRDARRDYQGSRLAIDPRHSQRSR